MASAKKSKTAKKPKTGILFGYAERKINPAVPVSLAGYFNVRMWTGVLDDIWAQVLVLKQGAVMSAIVKFDLIGVTAELTEAVRKKIADIPGLNPRHILFTATHAHTAPVIRDGKGGNKEYTAFLVDQAASAIREAAHDLQPGTLLWGSVEDSRFAYNRRYWMKTGEVVTNPPRQDPNIDKPEGPIDPQIGIVGIAQKGKLKILLANIVNHSDTIWRVESLRRLARILPPNT